MEQRLNLTTDQMNDLLVRARQERSDHLAHMAKTACHRLHRACTRPAAQHRKLAKSAIAPLTAGYRHNRSSVNPLMLRGLAIS